MKKIFLCLILIIAVKISEAQFSRYIIQFRNKAGSSFSLNNPIQYLSQKAIDRRTRYSIAVDSTDLPITPRYIDSIRLAGAVTILNSSRWLNQVSIQTSDAAALSKINSFPFVQVVAPIASRTAATLANKKPDAESQRVLNTAGTTNVTADFFSYGSSYNQVHIHNGEFLHNIGLRGQNMTIGIFDGGFFHYTTLKSFDSVNINGQVLGTYDFVAREQSVIEDDSHGMQCFSVIAANIPGQFVGTAPKANFYLFRSEDGASEFPIEEHNWVCAAERLDSSGGDLISSSLGYNTFDDPAFNHTYADMNGNTTIVTRGADLAAKKGLFVINSAGNEGNNSWKFIAAPADGDSVMAVGAVDASGGVAPFSSYGPSSDNQTKPDVASVGVNTVVQTPSNTIGTNSGTSFSAPNIAGLTTCLWQGFQEFNNIKILNALRQSGSKAASPDNRVGYGIPDVKKAVLILLKDFSTASATASSCKNTISWTSKDVSSMKYEIERKTAGETAYTKVGERQGAGTSFSSRTYSFDDSLINVQAGLISYRIRQIIDTATTTLSADYIDTVSVNLASSCITTAINPVTGIGEEVILMPNPVKERFALKITTSYPVQKLVIRVINNKGQVLSVIRNSKGSGTTTIELPSAYLASGQYYVSIYNDEKLIATKELIKLQ
ncbi:MAG: family serine peptidase [Flavisolibacter sp.]|jgi:serine protease AprX|nr:family serine peptidase [Flavisolibacter sp.]